MPKAVIDGTATLIGHYNPNQTLRLVIGLQPPHPEEEEQFLRDVQTKDSPEFHHFLTTEQWNARFAPSVQDEQAVVDWATSQGLRVTHRYPNRLLVDMEGPVSTIEKAFGVVMNSYQRGATMFFSSDREPTIPGSLSTIIHSVGGLNNWEVMQPSNKTLHEPAFPVYVPGDVVSIGALGGGDGDRAKLPLPKSTAKGPAPGITNGNYDPTDLYSSEAYDVNALDALGHCCNPFHGTDSPPEASVAIVTAGAQDPNDFQGFHNQYPYLAWRYFFHNIDGTPTCCDGEGTMDFEWSTAMANSFGSLHDTASVHMYDAVNSAFSTFTDAYNQILADGSAKVVTTSWGCAEFDCATQATMDSQHAVFNNMIGQGITMISISHDGGATTSCVHHDAVSYPGSDPDVVSAGGTELSLDSFGNYLSETGWTGGPGGCAPPANDGGSGGGFSAYWATPSYQSSMGFSMRAVPDLALNADGFHTPQNIVFGGSLVGNGGTSIVAPEVAGFYAQSNAYLLFLGNICGGSGTSPCAPQGDPHVSIYGSGNFRTEAHFPFYDITSGCNNNDITAFYGLGFFCAAAGYDEVTGWGSINFLQMAWAMNWFNVAESSPPVVTFTGPATSRWYNTDQAVSWTVVDQGGGFPPSGVAGFTQGWDQIPSDPFSEATPGSGNSFYSGPQFPNGTAGCLSFAGGFGCSGGSGQGMHTVHVQAWDNMGLRSGDVTYGPIGYDTIPPHTTGSLSGTVSPVRVTLTATDNASGVASTVYQLDGGAVQNYSGPFVVASTGNHTVNFHSTDVAGNVEATQKLSWTETPTVSSVSPNAGPTAGGNTVTINGTNFVAGSTVKFGTTASASVTFVSAAQLKAVAPAHVAGTIDVTVTTPSGTSATSSADHYTYDAQPSVGSVSPNVGPTAGGNTVTINGTNFVAGSTVKFGTAASASVTFVLATQLKAVAPAHAVGTVDATVTTPGGTSATSSADHYTYDAKPTVSSVSPDAGSTVGGNSVTINGTNFVAGSTVKFGTTASGSVTFVSATQLKAVAPAHAAGTVDVTVTTPGGTSTPVLGDHYAYGSPTVSSFTPSSGITGSTVTITGASFVPGATVKFGTIASHAVTFISGTQIKAVVPNGAVTGKISVTSPAGTGTSASNFTVTLSITGFSPSSGPTGTVVTISGVGFNSSSTVKFNGTAATSVTHVSSTQLKATVPSTATTGPISVTNTSAPTGTVGSAASYTKT
jgi:hypothetical protein